MNLSDLANNRSAGMLGALAQEKREEEIKIDFSKLSSRQQKKILKKYDKTGEYPERFRV